MCSKSERGLTLIELLVFIVIVGVAAYAMLAVFSSLTRGSASLLPDKQAQAIAAGLMNEILAQPVAATPGGHRAGFDSVMAYNTLGNPVPVAVSFPDGSPVAGLAGYTVQVSVTTGAAILSLPPIPLPPAADRLYVTVTVTSPGGGAVARFDGVRINYAS